MCEGNKVFVCTQPGANNRSHQGILTETVLHLCALRLNVTGIPARPHPGNVWVACASRS